MPGQLLLISERREDIYFFKGLSAKANYAFHHARDMNHVRRLLAGDKDFSVVIDADMKSVYEFVIPVVLKYVPGKRMFTISDRHDTSLTILLKRSFSGHHLIRRFRFGSEELYANMLLTSFDNSASGLSLLLPPKSKIQKLLIKRVAQKGPTVEGIHSVMGKLGVRERLSALVAQSTDELILNAIFDAPLTPDGFRSLHQRPRNLDIELQECEYVEVQLGAAQQYVGISVIDKFGSLKRESLAIVFAKQVKSRDAGGLTSIMRSGLSLMYHCEPGHKTEMTIVFPRVENYKDFRNGFRLFSMISR